MVDFFSLPIAAETILFVAVLSMGMIGFFLSIFLFVQNRRFKKELRELFSGKQAADLETVIMRQSASLKELDHEIQELYDISTRLYQLSQESIHKTNLIRFNPFKEVGGNQSFVVAFLNGHNSGFVISSIHTREGTRIYAKPVESGSETKDFPLTTEEKQAIAVAAAKHTDIFTKSDKHV